jgi:hypothetical protein
VNQHSSTAGATTSVLPKSIYLEHLLAVEDEDDPAVFSSTIYEQFSLLMKTNENINKEMAFPSMSLPYEKSKSKKISDLDMDLDDFADVDGSLLKENTNSDGGVLKSIESLTSADILSKLINDVDNEEDNEVGDGDVLPVVSTDVLPVASAYGEDKKGAELNYSSALETSQALRNAELKEQKLLHYNSENSNSVGTTNPKTCSERLFHT